MGSIHYGKHDTEAAVRAVETPKGSRSWNPVSYGSIIDMVEIVAGEYGVEILDHTFSLGRDGRVCVGLATFEGDGPTDGGSMVRSLGWLQSLDKTHARTFIQGASVQVCTNGVFNADGVLKLKRKNTTYAHESLRDMVQRSFGAMEYQFQQANALQRHLQGITLRDFDAHAALGVFRFGAEGMPACLTSDQVNEAGRQWHTPKHPEFGPRNAWSFFNACTEAAKRSQPQNYGNALVGITSAATQLFQVPQTPERLRIS